MNAPLSFAVGGDHAGFDYKNDLIAFLEAKGDHHILFIPCGAHIPSEGDMSIGGVSFSIDRKLKTYHHLPLSIRIQKLACSYLCLQQMQNYIFLCLFLHGF